MVTLFEKNKYPTSHELEQAADETGQPLKKIRGWFQSQRNKERKKQGLVGSGKRLSEAEEAALKASVKNESLENDIMNTNDSMPGLFSSPPTKSENDNNNPEVAPTIGKPASSPKPKKQAAKRKSSKDKDNSSSNNSSSMNNKTNPANSNNITSMQNTGMINSMNPRFPMHHVQSEEKIIDKFCLIVFM